MLKDFWEEKKHLIQIVGSLTAVGTLFLTIPRPEDVVAYGALLNIQFFWLVIIFVSVASLLFSLFLFLIRFEKISKEKHQIDFDFGLSSGFVMFALFFLFYLLRYTIILYRSSIQQINYVVGPVLGSLCSAVYLYVDRKFFSRNIHFILRDLISAFFISSILMLYAFAVAGLLPGIFLLLVFSLLMLFAFTLATVLRYWRSINWK